MRVPLCAPPACHTHFLPCGVSVGMRWALGVHADGKLWSSSSAVWMLPRQHQGTHV